MVGAEKASDSRPTMTRIQVTNRPKLSATTTPKLEALLFHRNTAATAAPTKPITPSGPMGIRSPGSRNASAIIAAIAVAVTQHIGTMAMNDDWFIARSRRRLWPARRPSPAPAAHRPAAAVAAVARTSCALEPASAHPAGPD